MTRKTAQNITTVSLLETWEIKQNMMREGGNFSRFVRNCLREWAGYEQGVICLKETTTRELLCFPRDARLCLACWPEGPPPSWSWNDYSGVVGEGAYQLHDQDTPHRSDDEWILSEAREMSALNSDNWTVQNLAWTGRPSRTHQPPKVKPGIWARIKALLSR